MVYMATVEIAKSLISFDTSGPPTREKPLADWIHDYLEDIGVESQVQVIEPERANVIAKIGEGKSPGLVLSGHIDVVPAGDLSLWTESEPFKARVANGRLYGRGACDMKGPDACILQAVKELKDEDFKRQLTIAFTAGEDTGGWFVDKVLEEHLVTPKEAMYGIIPEPSMMKLVRSHKGGAGATVVVHGKAAHSSRPELGVNAILHASDFLQEVTNLQEALNKTRHPLLGSSTIKPTLIKGGFKANIIPDRCDVTLNLRLLPEHSKSELVEEWLTRIVKQLQTKYPDFRAEITGLRASEALDIPEDSGIVRLVMSLLDTEIIGVPYYTEAVSYTKNGIPTIICGPGDIEQAHTPNEFISLDQLDRGTELFRKAIRKVCL